MKQFPLNHPAHSFERLPTLSFFDPSPAQQTPQIPSSNFESVQSWLTEIPQLGAFSPLPETTVTPRKRKRGSSNELSDAIFASSSTAEARMASSGSMTPSKGPPEDNAPVTPSRSSLQHSRTVSTDPPQPTPSTQKSKAKSLYDVRSHMEEHGIYRDQNTLGKAGFEQFCEQVMQVTNGTRASTVKAESAAKFKSRLQWTSDDNEDTILQKLIPCIIKDGRSVQAMSTEKRADEDALNAPEQPFRIAQSGQTREDKIEYVVENFEVGGLQFSTNRQFKRTYLPNVFDDRDFEAVVVGELAKEKGMTNPKPDRVYGLNMGELLRPRGYTLRSETKDLITLVPNMVYAFFLIEGKSSGGDMTKAMEQACRGACCLVIALRELLRISGRVEESGPDWETYVYSATMDGNSMMIWVHFAVVSGSPEGIKNVEIHMELIFAKHFRDNDALLTLRQVCHNILDWGIGERKASFKKLYGQVASVEGPMIVAEAVKSRQKVAAGKEERNRDSKKRKLP